MQHLVAQDEADKIPHVRAFKTAVKDVIPIKAELCHKKEHNNPISSCWEKRLSSMKRRAL